MEVKIPSHESLIWYYMLNIVRANGDTFRKYSDKDLFCISCPRTNFISSCSDGK